MEFKSNLGDQLHQIQTHIKSINCDKIKLECLSKILLVDYNKNLNLFVMDSFTRCLNLKKSFDQEQKEQVTTHCASYFKFEAKENSVQNVSKIFLASNKNSNVLLERSKRLMSLIGYQMKEKYENGVCKFYFQKLATYDPQLRTKEFYEALDYKFGNFYEAFNYFTSNGKLNGSHLNRSEFLSNGASIFQQWYSNLNNIDTDKIKCNEKLKNAFQDSSLFYFYLNVFVNFTNEFFNLNNCELVICKEAYGLHCEVNLVSSFLNDIDRSKNSYISVSSDSCILCHLVLKNLDLSCYGAKNNICSSRYWKLPQFNRNILQQQFIRIKNFYSNLGRDFRLINESLAEKRYCRETKIYQDELPYSDEWIENQYDFCRRLLRVKQDDALAKFKKALRGKNLIPSHEMLANELSKILDVSKAYFSKQSFDRFFNFKIKPLLKYYINESNELRKFKNNAYKNVADSIGFKINTKIDYFFKLQVEMAKVEDLNGVKRKIEDIATSNEI